MNRAQFLADPQVQDFINWLASVARIGLLINLNIPHSRFVPGGIHAVVHGLPAVLGLYQWNASWTNPFTHHITSSGNWSSTRASLAALSAMLRGAIIATGSQTNALAACRSVLIWGGNRNFAKGAFPFLSGHAVAGTLIQYLQACQTALSLSTARTGSLCPPVTMMNSMLTKVHARLALDGLPIYDSRVAAAIATLVEMYRISISVHGNALSPLLTFPATLPNRTVKVKFPRAITPGIMIYGHPHTPSVWASAKVRLGWILEQVLTQEPNLFPGGSMPDRMHSFEASLFMIGYDVRCL